MSAAPTESREEVLPGEKLLPEERVHGGTEVIGAVDGAARA